MKTKFYPVRTIDSLKRILLPGAIACLVATPALAQLHSTLDECTAKWGKPRFGHGSGDPHSETDFDSRLVGGQRIEKSKFVDGTKEFFVDSINGRAVSVAFDIREDGVARKLSDNDVEELLNSNSEGSNWAPLSVETALRDTKVQNYGKRQRGTVSKVWERADKKAIAILLDREHTPTVLGIFDLTYFDKEFVKSEEESD